MSKLLALILTAHFLTGCTEDAYASRLRRAGSFRGTPNKAQSEPPDALSDTFSDWLFTFSGEDLADPWLVNEGTDSDISLDSTGEDTATGGQSTSGLTTRGGIGTARADQGILFDGLECYRDALTSAVGAFGPDVHVRMLFKFNGSANDFIMGYRADATNSVRIQTNGTSNLRVVMGNDVTYNCDSSGTLSTDTWYLLDYIYDADGGATSKGKASIFLNGTATSCAETTVAGSQISGGGHLAIGDDYDCGNKNMNGVFLFMGFRESLTGIDETVHDADCVSLGLC